MTTAQQITATMGSDGQVWGTADGKSLGDHCAEAGASVTTEYHTTVYEFADRSAIVASGDAWDIRAEGCEGACWSSVGCTCRRVACIFEDIGGYYLSDAELGYYDARGTAYQTKARAMRAALANGYTHARGSGCYWSGTQKIPARFAE